MTSGANRKMTICELRATNNVEYDGTPVVAPYWT
jgi:hypothetical protein